MDPLDLIIEQSSQYHAEIEEIEHWCPVCDRLITPTCTLVSTPTAQTPIENTRASNTAPTSPTSPITPAERPTTPTTPLHKRKAALRGGRPSLYRSRTSMFNAATGTHQHKKKQGAVTTGTDHASRSNPNLVQDFVLSTHTHGGGATATAPRTKTSQNGDSSHSDNAKIDEDLQGEAGLVLRTKDRTDRRPDPQSREGVPSAGVIKRKASVCFFIIKYFLLWPDAHPLCRRPT